MIDKQFDLYRCFYCNLALCPMKMVSEAYEIYFTCYTWNYLGVENGIFQWQVLVYDTAGNPLETEYFRTYLEAEKWLRKSGYL